MRIFNKITVLCVAIATIGILTSALPASKAKISPERIKAASLAYDLAAKDGKVTYTELKSIAADFKGSNLTLKEKLALKVFNKKLSKKGSMSAGSKSQLVALLLCGFLGGIGVHRFYLGYTWQGIVQLLTAGGCGIWATIDFVRIILGTLKPKDGEYDVTL
jgi:TM2 domain-containing membrane protein YozV